MQRIIYLCPADNTPTGGVKVIYRHAEILAGFGCEAAVLHPLDTSFRCSWFTHNVRLLDRLDLEPRSDFVIIPELWAGIFGPQCLQQKVRYAIFVQNGYLTHPILTAHPAHVMRQVYEGAELILAISEDTARMVALNYPGLVPDRFLRIQYSVAPVFSRQPERSDPRRIITYMPRKMADHSRRVVFALEQRLPKDWTIIPIHNVDEGTCARLLCSSSIFLSFSEFEGLPLPPMEAALSGNLVVGYTGQGAKEYWQSPTFRAIEQGDVICFVEAAHDAAMEIDQGSIHSETLLPGITMLADRYSPVEERRLLLEMLSRISILFQGCQNPDSELLQKSA